MKTHIISGAGTGIGLAIAELLAKNPENHLVLIGRNGKNLSDLISRLENPKQHNLIVGSVTDEKLLNRAFTSLKLEDKNVTSVIANAGIGGENHYGENDRWDEIINTNIKGVYNLGNEALPYLKQAISPYRHVVIISSVVAHMGIPMHTAYCTSKAGVLGLMRSWAAQWAAEKILVNAICPGWVETEMARAGMDGIAKAQDISFDQAREQQISLLPLKKISAPNEIAALAKFLISGEQTSITGEEIQINNGSIMH
jgi:NAD(P)-dependent dehydrogenase (short-subunit alcohol dehydrogenase family)